MGKPSHKLGEGPRSGGEVCKIVDRQPSTDCGLSEPEKSAVDANRLPFGIRGKTKKSRVSFSIPANKMAKCP